MEQRAEGGGSGAFRARRRQKQPAPPKVPAAPARHPELKSEPMPAKRKLLREIGASKALEPIPSEKAAAVNPQAARDRALAVLARFAATPDRVDQDKISEIPLHKLTTAAAIIRGAHILNREAPAVLELLALYARDPDSPHHQWALQLLADRILPAKTLGALAAKEAGLDDRAPELPRIVINVVSANAPKPVDAVVTSHRAPEQLEVENESDESSENRA